MVRLETKYIDGGKLVLTLEGDEEVLSITLNEAETRVLINRLESMGGFVVEHP